MGQRINPGAGGGAQTEQANRALVQCAYEEAVRVAATRREGPPSIEEVCAELWKLGVTMAFSEVSTALEALSLATTARQEFPDEPTRKVPPTR